MNCLTRLVCLPCPIISNGVYDPSMNMRYQLLFSVEPLSRITSQATYNLVHVGQVPSLPSKDKTLHIMQAVTAAQDDVRLKAQYMTALGEWLVQQGSAKEAGKEILLEAAALLDTLQAPARQHPVRSMLL